MCLYTDEIIWEIVDESGNKQLNQNQDQDTQEEQMMLLK